MIERRPANTPGAARPASDAECASAEREGGGEASDSMPGFRLHPAMVPSVAELLSVDREYRHKARAGSLHRIAPHRFNPSGEAWLPIFHTTRGETRYTALFSNTALAHRLGRTDDWVVLYWDRGDGEEQNTVVTETGGPLRGKRVVRGREQECLRFYNTLERLAARRRPSSRWRGGGGRSGRVVRR